MLKIGEKAFSSRLLLGTGKFSSPQLMQETLKVSKTEIVTIALRRVDLNAPKEDMILPHLDREKYLLMANTSGAMNAEEAIRFANLAESAGLPKWIKIEIHPNPQHLLPDPIETLKATEALVKKGFTVLPYTNSDPILAKHLEEAGAAMIMPLGSFIGSKRGLENKESLQIIIDQSSVPVAIDAGIGKPSHAVEAMEMGADALLINTAIACANHPPLMAESFRIAIDAGRKAYQAGILKASETSATSPIARFLSNE